MFTRTDIIVSVYVWKCGGEEEARRRSVENFAKFACKKILLSYDVYLHNVYTGLLDSWFRLC